MNETPESHQRRLSIEQSVIKLVTEKVAIHGGVVFSNSDEAHDAGFRLELEKLSISDVNATLGQYMHHEHGEGNWGVSFLDREGDYLNTSFVHVWSVEADSELEQTPKRVTSAGKILKLVQNKDLDTDIDNK